MQKGASQNEKHLCYVIRIQYGEFFVKIIFNFFYSLFTNRIFQDCKQAKKLAAFADGVIVGSAIVKIVEQYGIECVPHVGKYIHKMLDAVK